MRISTPEVLIQATLKNPKVSLGVQMKSLWQSGHSSLVQAGVVKQSKSYHKPHPHPSTVVPFKGSCLHPMLMYPACQSTEDRPEFLYTLANPGKCSYINKHELPSLCMQGSCELSLWFYFLPLLLSSQLYIECTSLTSCTSFTYPCILLAPLFPLCHMYVLHSIFHLES